MKERAPGGNMVNISHMQFPTRIVLLSVVILAASALFAAQPTYNYSDKTVVQLLELLESKDSTVRHCAAIFLGDRYRNPEAIVINGPVHKPNSPPPQFPIPTQVIPHLAEHLKSDPDVLVRMCTVFALCDLRYRTNTTPILLTGLDDKDKIVRIRTCTALIGISHDYTEPLQTRVIPTLIDCLNPNGEVEQIWQAAYCAEQLGTNGTAVIPALRTLLTHDSPKVRDYAGRALLRIKPATKE
jgi:HEAT repeat protein